MDYSPYAPPAAGSHVEVAIHRPLAWKTTAAAIAISLSVGAGIMLHVVTLALGPLSPKDLIGIMLLGILSLATQVVSLVAPVLFLMWMYQASKNVHAFGRLGLTFTPGWCVGWWFVPFASMVMPYQALKEIFRASAPTANVGADADVAWRTGTVPSTFLLWWGTYVTNGFVGLVAVGLSVSSALKHEPASATAGLLLGISLFLSAMSAVSVIAIMRVIHRRQEATWAQLSEGSVASSSLPAR
jgi:hypothetical protein